MIDPQIIAQGPTTNIMARRSYLSWQCKNKFFLKANIWSSFSLQHIFKTHFWVFKTHLSKYKSSSLGKKIFKFPAWKKAMFQNDWSSSERQNWTRVTWLKALCSAVCPVSNIPCKTPGYEQVVLTGQCGGVRASLFSNTKENTLKLDRWWKTNFKSISRLIQHYEL